MEPTKEQSLAVASIWYERYLECSRTYGTDEFPNSVWRFYRSLLNLGKEKLAIKDIVQNYVTNTWYPEIYELIKADCKRDRVDLDMKSHRGRRELIKKQNEKREICKIFEFIIQTIQDSGKGWPSQEELTNFRISQQ